MSEILGTQFTDNLAPLVGGPEWLADLRRDGQERFSGTGLPRRKLENWRYTDITSLDKSTWTTPVDGEPTLNAERLDVLTGDQPRLVLVDGLFQPNLSRLDGVPEGARLMSLADCLANEPELLGAHLGKLAVSDVMPLAALNTAWIGDGAVLMLAPGVQVDRALHIVSFGTGNGVAFHPRFLIVAERGSVATVVEHHLAIDPGTYFSNSVSEIFVGPGARINHTKIQDEALAATHLAATHIKLDDDAVYRGFVLQKGARLARHEAVVDLGCAADCRISGAYLGAGEQHQDITLRIDHLHPGATSRQHIRGVLAGRARGVFQGKITVHKGAQKTDGQQMSRALLLSPDARVSAKPELEIYADDVKCGHGATTGALSKEALFYLTARGIDRETARALLIGAFVAEVLGDIIDETSRAAAQILIGKWLLAQTGYDWRGELIEESAA